MSDKERLKEIEERGWSHTAQCAEDWRWLVDEANSLRSNEDTYQECIDYTANEIVRLNQEMDSLTKERDRFKRIAENLLSDYNWIQYNEYSNEPIKLEDFEEPIDREADSL